MAIGMITFIPTYFGRQTINEKVDFCEKLYKWEGKEKTLTI